jgi:hypothetical protein
MDINGRKLDVKIASPKGNRPPKSIQKPVAKKVEKKAFNKFDSRQKPYAQKEKVVIKPNPVERDSDGKVIRKED